MVSAFRDGQRAERRRVERRRFFVRLTWIAAIGSAIAPPQ